METNQLIFQPLSGGVYVKLLESKYNSEKKPFGGPKISKTAPFGLECLGEGV